MPSETGNYCTYIALTLAAMAAILSMPGRADATYQKLQWLLQASALPEAAAIAGAIGERPDALLSP